MSYNLIHRGIFYSRENVQWDIRILREQYWEEEEVGDLSFSGDEPLVIEWDEKSKEEVICGSTATLKLISPEDGTYLDLYSVAVGEYRLEVLKNGVLYWSGTLDPEFYEEPYSWEKDYEVTLTFSDFGILDRQKYVLAGLKTLREILDYCLERSCILYSGIDATMLSTSLDVGSSMSLSDLTVRSDNFYDEDGEPCSLKEVLEGVFQPLGLRMVQRGGVVWVYDLNGLYGCGVVEKVEWMSDDQTLSVDSVYNNVKVTWSPYAQSGVLTSGSCYLSETDAGVTSISGAAAQDGLLQGDSLVYSYHYGGDLSRWHDETDVGFSLWVSKAGENAELSDSLYPYPSESPLGDHNPHFFRIIPQADGAESEGIAVQWPSVRSDGPHHLSVRYNGLHPTVGNIESVAGGKIFSSQRIWLSPSDGESDLRLRLSLNMLLDCRINPFEPAPDESENLANIKKQYENWEKWANFVYVPVCVKFQPDGSDDVYVWTNLDVVKTPRSTPIRTIEGSLGMWREYESSAGGDPKSGSFGYLAWYDSTDREDKCGVLGWKKNRQAINAHSEQLPTALKGDTAGQLIPYPTFGGRGGMLWVEVYLRGWILADHNNELTETDPEHLMNAEVGLPKWLLLELPEIEIVRARQFSSSVSSDDIEYTGVLNESAREDLELETICGTSVNGVPAARGAYYRSSTLTQVKSLSRGGRTSQAEDLLIGTLYSQFGDRKLKLDGTTTLPSDRLCLYREATMGERRFLLTGAVEDAGADLCESVLVELRPDEYDKER